MIVAGERRFRASKIAGLKKIPAVVKDYTDDQIKEIALLEASLTEMKEDNRINYERVMGSVSLSDILKIATEELGMVYSTNGQVIYYDSVNPDYVKQYRDIPE